MRARIPIAIATAAILLVAAHGGQPYDGSWTIEDGCQERPCRLVTEAENHGGLVRTAGEFEGHEEHHWGQLATIIDDRPTWGPRQAVRVTATFEVTAVELSPPEEADGGSAAVNLVLTAFQPDRDGSGPVRSSVSEQLAEFHVVAGPGLPPLILPLTRVESSQAQPGTYTLETTLVRDDGEPLGSNKVLVRAEVAASGFVQGPTAFSYDVVAKVTSISVEPA